MTETTAVAGSRSRRKGAENSAPGKGKRKEEDREKHVKQGKGQGRNGRERQTRARSPSSESENSSGGLESRRRARKAKKSTREVHEGTEDSSSASSGAVLSEPSSSSSVGSSEPRGDKKRQKRYGKRRGSDKVHWELVNAMWALEDRPRHLQDRKVVGSMTIVEISQFKEHYEKEELRKGGGSAIFGKDSMLKAKKFRAAVDDGREQARLTGADTGRPV